MLLVLLPPQVLSRAASGAMQLAPACGGGTGAGPAAGGTGTVLTVNDFLLRTGLDNLNLFKLVRWAGLAERAEGPRGCRRSRGQRELSRTSRLEQRRSRQKQGVVALSCCDHQGPPLLASLLSPRCCSYVRESKAVFKIAGYWQAQQKREAAAAAGAATGTATAAAAARAGSQASAAAAAAPPAEAAAGTGALHALLGFLQALTNADADGRIVVQPPAQAPQQPHGGGGRSTAHGSSGGAAAAAAAAAGGGAGAGGAGEGLLKFVLLNAAAHFGRVVSAAHAVVLASGTLSPLESVLHLFPGVPPERLHRFACGHVVGKER